MIDLFALLGNLPKENLGEDGQLVKYAEVAAKEPMPKYCRIYFGIRQYNPKGLLLTILRTIIYKPQDHCQGIQAAMASMGKEERSWFRIPQPQTVNDRHLANVEDHCTFVQITIEEVRLKMADQMNLSDRKDLYNQNKEDADDAFSVNKYADAAKHYLSCINCINNLPRKMKRNQQDDNSLLQLIRICQRNFVICVVKGGLTSEHDKARILINKLAEMDPSAKTFYLQGKLMLQMKYLSNAKEALKKSYELEANQKTLNLLKSIRDHRPEGEVYKHIINNMEAERVKQSKQQKKEKKDDWFEAAERAEERKLITMKVLRQRKGDKEDEMDEVDIALLNKQCYSLN